jgi:hypothetical protein
MIDVSVLITPKMAVHTIFAKPRVVTIYLA